MAQLLTIPLSRTLFKSSSIAPSVFSSTTLRSRPLPRISSPSHPLRRHFAMAPIPPTQKAVQISKNGGPEVLEYKDIPVPKPAADQVLIKNAFAGINYIDTYFRSGLYATPHFPRTLGRDGAGEVVAAGSAVSSIPVGARVVYMSDDGSYAQYTAVKAKEVIVIPEGLSLEIALASYLQGLTAWTFVREAGEVKAGQWVLVHAAAGGVGTLLTQMLRTVGAKVIGTASTEEKCALARKNGCEWTINSNDDVVAKVKEITGGHGVDVILDGVGKATFDADLEMIAVKGALISFGNASGAVPPLNILRLTPKNVRLMRPNVSHYVAERPDLEKYTTELFEMITSGKLEIAIHKVYPLADIAQAHTDIESRKTTGKLLIKCD